MAVPKARAAAFKRRWVAWAGLLIGLATVAVGLALSQGQAQQQLDGVFQTRVEIARQFVTSYVRDVIGREEAVARAQFSTATIDDAKFQAAAQAFGFKAALVLDARGDALDILPPSPKLLGTNFTSKYTHLRSAEAGVATVSHVVESTIVSRSVVAFAVPFDTPSGRRVFSGGFDVNASPVATYLNNALPLNGAAAYLVDRQSGVVVADKSGPTANAAPLASQAPQLATAIVADQQGNFTGASGSTYFVQRDVLNSPWRLIMSVPDAALYAPLNGATKWAPWAIFAVFAVGAVSFGRTLQRLQHNRVALGVANADLVLLARIDKLTGVYNRRHMDEQIDALLHTAARDSSTVSLLMLDVDHFKAINDGEGHAVGDSALQSIAAAIRLNIRPGDIFGRWGGEEFVVLLPGTATEAARVIAERLREAVSEAPVTSRRGRPLAVTISVGVATAERADIATALVARADVALYRAKGAGRNAVAA